MLDRFLLVCQNKFLIRWNSDEVVEIFTIWRFRIMDFFSFFFLNYVCMIVYYLKKSYFNNGC